MNYNLLYVLLISLIFGGFMAYTSNIYVAISLIFFIIKIIQLELLNSKGDILPIIERNISLYFFIGDVFLLLYLSSNQLLTEKLLLLVVFANLYIYLNFFLNRKIHKRAVNMIFEPESQDLFGRETNPTIMLIHFPIYYYLMMNYGEVEKVVIDEILTYSFYLFAFVVFSDFGLRVKKKNFIANGFDYKKKKYVFKVDDITDIDKLQEYDQTLEKVKEKVLLLVPVDTYRNIDFIRKYAHMYISLDSYLRLQPNDVKSTQLFVALRDQYIDMKEGMRSVYLDSNDYLGCGLKKRLLGSYDFVFVLGESIREKFLSLGYQRDIVRVVGIPKIPHPKGTNNKEHLLYLLRRGEPEDFKDLLYFIKKNVTEIISGSIILEVDFSFLDSTNEVCREGVALIEEVLLDVNEKILQSEMVKSVNTKDLLSKGFYTSYNGTKVVISNKGSSLEGKLSGVDIVITDSVSNLWEMLSYGVYCVISNKKEFDSLGRILRGVYVLGEGGVLDIKDIKGEIMLPKDIVATNDPLVLLKTLEEIR